MGDNSRILRSSVRAAVGLLVVGIGVSGVITLSSVTLPSVTRDPVALTVDTTQNATRTLVCSGSFEVLGADGNRPDVAIPLGTPSVALAGTAGETRNLARAEGGDGLPTVYQAPAADPLAAAQSQSISTETLRGTVAGSCEEPLNEQWLLGGASTTGVSTTLSIGNPGEVPATVTVTAYDENGLVAGQHASMLVAPGVQQTVSVNGYAPDRERLALRVESTGAPVTASLGVGHTIGLDPFAVSAVSRQAEPATSVAIPGIVNVSDQKAAPSDAGEGDEYPVVIRVLAPGETGGTAVVSALTESGEPVVLGQLDLVAGAISELSVPTWPTGATSVHIDAEVPVIASALGSVTDEGDHDYEWFSAAAALPADTPTAVSVLRGGRLVVANAGDDVAEVTVSDLDGGNARTETVGPHRSVVLRAPAAALLTTTAPVSAGVSLRSGGDLAAYPVATPTVRDGALTVYPR